MTLQHSLPLLEIRAQPQGLIEGYASVFGGIDMHGDSVVKGAYATSLKSHDTKGTAPVMLWAHKMDAPIGRWLGLAEDSRGLRVSGQLNMKTAAGREAFEHLQAGDLNGLSIGFRVPSGGREYSNGVSYLKQVELHEISVVSVPSDSAARISSVKSLTNKPTSIRELEAALQDLGYSRREAKNIACKGFAAIADPDTSDELIQALKAATQHFQKA